MTVDAITINTIRAVAADTVQGAKSGHPGAPMGMAAIAAVLFGEVMHYTPSNINWLNRDRFVLSNGHACALLYTMLHLCGYSSVSIQDLQRFRQAGSSTPGHPENFHTAGIEVTTGPLGQGLANAVGMAMTQKYLQHKFQLPEELLNHRVYVFVGDGCLMEGITSEASSLAGHLGLDNLVVIYDDNKISIDGSTDLAFTEDVQKRYEAYGWNVATVHNADADVDAIEKAIRAAATSNNGRPTLISMKTIIGYGSKQQGTEKVHGAPLGDEDILEFKRRFGLSESKFHVPQSVYDYFAAAGKRGAEAEKQWSEKLKEHMSTKMSAEDAAQLQRLLDGKQELPEGWQQKLPRFTCKDPAEATRKLSGVVLQKLAVMLPELFGGSADLAESNCTKLKGEKSFMPSDFSGRLIHFGVREHAMAAICNGVASYQTRAFIPFAATFLNFMGYMVGAARLSALSQFRVLYVMTHDSIGLGEDGPTHQPIETLASLRAMPNFHTFRPADGNEVTGSYISAVENTHTPSAICLSRQNLPQLEGSNVEKTVQRGGYTVLGSEDDASSNLILISSGSEVSICVEAAKLLHETQGLNVRVVSVPCMEIFEKQDAAYLQKVLPDGIPVLSVEAAATFGWERFSHAHHGIDRFGLSGPYKDVYAFFGLTPEGIADRANKVVQFYAGKQVPSLVNKVQF